MRQQFSPVNLVLFLLVLISLLIFIQLGFLTIAFDKLGISPAKAYLLLGCSLMGSAINLPLFTIKNDTAMQQMPLDTWRLLRVDHTAFEGRTLIAINVGGCLIPFGFSLYLLTKVSIGLFHVLLGIFLVAVVSFLASRPIEGRGIGIPIFIAPIGAALVAVLISPEYSAPLAYIAGTLGVIIGADLLRLKDIRHMGTPIVSIGGAGTFDGIFITGIVAVLLA